MRKTCFVKNTYELVSKKWLFQILCCFKDEKSRRFTEIMKSLKGISTKTLSQRLNELVKNEILSKKIFKETPPRVEYSLTKKGKKLLISLEPLEEWAEKWV